jgi:hypothetical protein
MAVSAKSQNKPGYGTSRPAARRTWACRCSLVNGDEFKEPVLPGCAHPGSAPTFFFERCRLQFLDTLRLMIFHFLFSLLMSASVAVPHQSTMSSPVARPCAEGWDSAGPGTKKKPPKHAKGEPQNRAGACIELSFPPLEIQEYLQSYARSQQWKISQEQVTEDSWTITRELSKEELLGATKRNSGMVRVTWTAGVVHLHISTAQVAEGYARTLIRASFRGYGQNADQFALPREYWDLESNSNLETSITSALEAHFKASQ